MYVSFIHFRVCAGVRVCRHASNIGCFCARCCPFVQKNGIRTKRQIGLSTKNDHLKINFQATFVYCVHWTAEIERIEIMTRFECEAIRYEWTSFINHLQRIYAKTFFFHFGMNSQIESEFVSLDRVASIYMAVAAMYVDFQTVQWLVRWATCLLFIDKFCIHLRLEQWIALNHLCNRFSRPLIRVHMHKRLHTIRCYEIHINLISFKAFSVLIVFISFLPNCRRFLW